MDDRNNSYYLKRNNELLEWVTETLNKWTGIKPTEKITLKAAPFQPECKCEVAQDEDGSLTIYHCQYHRSIKYLHNRLTDILEDRQLRTLDLMNMIYEDHAFLDECKKNSLTGEIGKARDENVGR